MAVDPTKLSLGQQAALVAAGIINPQERVIDRGVAAKTQAAQAAQLGYQQTIDAYGRLTAPIPGQIQGAYQQAADRTAGYASTLTGDLGARSQQQASDVAAQLARAGAPAGNAPAGPAAMNVLNYTHGVLPASDLAAQAASSLALENQLRTAGAAGLGQQALQAGQASQKEIEELRAKGVDIELTRPAEVQKAVLMLRDEKRKDAAEVRADAAEVRANQELAIHKKDFVLRARAQGIQEQQIERQWHQTLMSEADNLTDSTGTQWVVGRNGLVNTGRPAPGSLAGRAATTAYTAGQNRAAENARNAARIRGENERARLARIAKAKATGAGGLKQSDIRQYGKAALSIADQYFNGILNANYDPGKDPGPKNQKYSLPPQSAQAALSRMLARKIPRSIAMNAIVQYAQQAKRAQPWAGRPRWWDALYLPGGPYYNAQPTPDIGFTDPSALGAYAGRH